MITFLPIILQIVVVSGDNFFIDERPIENWKISEGVENDDHNQQGYDFTYIERKTDNGFVVDSIAYFSYDKYWVVDTMPKYVGKEEFWEEGIIRDLCMMWEALDEERYVIFYSKNKEAKRQVVGFSTFKER